MNKKFFIVLFALGLFGSPYLVKANLTYDNSIVNSNSMTCLTSCPGAILSSSSFYYGGNSLPGSYIESYWSDTFSCSKRTSFLRWVITSYTDSCTTGSPSLVGTSFTPANPVVTDININGIIKYVSPTDPRMLLIRRRQTQKTVRFTALDHKEFYHLLLVDVEAHDLSYLAKTQGAVDPKDYPIACDKIFILGKAGCYHKIKVQDGQTIDITPTIPTSSYYSYRAKSVDYILTNERVGCISCGTQNSLQSFRSKESQLGTANHLFKDWLSQITW